jgi:hypothetical protein
MSIDIVTASVTLDELRRMAAEQFGDLIKAVVDIQRQVMAIGGGSFTPTRKLSID